MHTNMVCQQMCRCAACFTLPSELRFPLRACRIQLNGRRRIAALQRCKVSVMIILPHCACAPRADSCNFCNRDVHVACSVQSQACPAGPPMPHVNTSSRAAQTPRTPRRLTFQDTIDGGGSPARHLQGLSDVPLRAGVRKTRCLSLGAHHLQLRSAMCFALVVTVGFAASSGRWAARQGIQARPRLGYRHHMKM